MGIVCSWSVDPKSRKGLGRGWPVISFLEEQDANQVMVRPPPASLLGGLSPVALPLQDDSEDRDARSGPDCFKMLRLYVGGRSRFPEFPRIWVPA